MQLASLERTVQGGNAYSALQRYRALFSRSKANVDDALLILSTVRSYARMCTPRRVSCSRRVIARPFRVPCA
jgi:hypothetical protein